ncbi:MAG: RluA family pseudouridine synthase [Lacrimispora saccharolytica]
MRELIFQEDAGQRLDKYLQKYLNLAPKSFLYKMLRKKNIVLNGKKAEGSEKLKNGDVIRLYLSEETLEKFHESRKADQYPRWPGLEIVYEDRQLLLVNKPAGMLSQKADPKDVSLNEYLVGYLLESGQVTPESLAGFTPGVCNRLDRNTSGLVIGAKTLVAAQEMGRLLKERRAGKYYLALVKGQVTRKERIRGWLAKDEAKNQARISREPLENGAPIETAYEPLAAKKDMTLLKVELITGKTHQIRSHLAGIGHPLAGDRKYGDAAFNRYFRENYGLNSQFLHSWQIEFPVMEPPLESVSQRTVTAKPPKLFQKILQAEKLSAGGK